MVCYHTIPSCFVLPLVLRSTHNIHSWLIALPASSSSSSSNFPHSLFDYKYWACSLPGSSVPRLRSVGWGTWLHHIQPFWISCWSEEQSLSLTSSSSSSSSSRWGSFEFSCWLEEAMGGCSVTVFSSSLINLMHLRHPTHEEEDEWVGWGTWLVVTMRERLFNWSLRF